MGWGGAAHNISFVFWVIPAQFIPSGQNKTSIERHLERKSNQRPRCIGGLKTKDKEPPPSFPPSFSLSKENQEQEETSVSLFLRLRFLLFQAVNRQSRPSNLPSLLPSLSFPLALSNLMRCFRENPRRRPGKRRRDLVPEIGGSGVARLIYDGIERFLLQCLCLSIIPTLVVCICL